jgi:hypothetical protein
MRVVRAASPRPEPDSRLRRPPAFVVAAWPRRLVFALAAVVAAAVLARVVYGGAMLGYDASWSLLWGRDLASGSWPDLEAPGAPTPHPLHILAAVPLGPLGPSGGDVLLALSWLSLGLLGWLAFRLGAELFSAPVGAVFAALLLTRPLLVLETRQAIVDVPFLALVAAAGLLALRDDRAGLRVPVLLCLAGLLRPEGWLLAVAWLAWAAPAAAPSRRVQLALLAAAAPVAWMLLDLAATGDPFHSLHVTRGLAEQLDRPRDLDTALREVPDYLRLALTPVVAWIGLAGAVAALVWLPDRALGPAGVAGLGLAAFLALGVAGLPLLTRYLLLPAAILMLLAAVLVAGFTAVERHRARWLAGGAAAVVALAVSAPSQVDDLSEAGRLIDLRRAIADDLERIVEEREVAAALRRCGGRLTVPDDRPRPLAAIVLDRSTRGIAVQGGDETAGAGVALRYADEAARSNFRIGPAPPPGGGPALAANESWLAAARC